MASPKWQSFIDLLDADGNVAGEIGVLASSLSRRLEGYMLLRYGIDFATFTDVIADPDVVEATAARLAHIAVDAEVVKAARENAAADVAEAAATLVANAEADDVAVKTAVIQAITVVVVKPVVEPVKLPVEETKR